MRFLLSAGRGIHLGMDGITLSRSSTRRNLAKVYRKHSLPWRYKVTCIKALTAITYALAGPQEMGEDAFRTQQEGIRSKQFRLVRRPVLWHPCPQNKHRKPHLLFS